MTQLRLSDFDSVEDFMEAFKTEYRGYCYKSAWSAAIVGVCIIAAIFLFTVALIKGA